MLAYLIKREPERREYDIALSVVLYGLDQSLALVELEAEFARLECASVKDFSALQRYASVCRVGVVEYDILYGAGAFYLERAVAVVGNVYGYRVFFCIIRYSGERSELLHHTVGVDAEILFGVGDIVEYYRSVRRVRLRLKQLAALIQIEAEFARLEFAAVEDFSALKRELARGVIIVLVDYGRYGPVRRGAAQVISLGQSVFVFFP